jgi:hypothetical protein
VGLITLLPLNSRFDTVKPCGRESACSVVRYKSLVLSFTPWEAPWNGLNRVTITAFVLISAGIGRLIYTIFLNRGLPPDRLSAHSQERFR